MDRRFVVNLQQLRDFLGVSLTITSAYRCEKRNKEVGGADSSWHMHGVAVDIFCVDGKTRHKLIHHAIMLDFHGIGIAPNFVHLDKRRLVNPLATNDMWVYPVKKPAAPAESKS
jgi:uncharacterized protein YcbK (DUF882 family)